MLELEETQDSTSSKLHLNDKAMETRGRELSCLRSHLVSGKPRPGPLLQISLPVSSHGHCVFPAVGEQRKGRPGERGRWVSRCGMHHTCWLSSVKEASTASRSAARRSGTQALTGNWA